MSRTTFSEFTRVEDNTTCPVCYRRKPAGLLTCEECAYIPAEVLFPQAKELEEFYQWIETM